MVRIICISDTHLRHSSSDIKVPDGDLLIHAGDLTISGSLDQLSQAQDWLSSLPHTHKVIIAGNHDRSLQSCSVRGPATLKAPGLTYLKDSGVNLLGFKIWGAPWSLSYGEWSFQEDSFSIGKHWQKIPEDTDILITHGPPYGLGDRVLEGYNVGCQSLRSRVESLKLLKLHVYGHIHEGYGMYRIPDRDTIFLNAATCKRRKGLPVNSPVIIDL